MKLGKGIVTVTDIKSGEVISEFETDGIEFFSDGNKYSIPCRVCKRDTGKVGGKYERGYCDECLKKTVRLQWSI